MASIHGMRSSIDTRHAPVSSRGLPTPAHATLDPSWAGVVRRVMHDASLSNGVVEAATPPCPMQWGKANRKRTVLL